MQAIGKYQVIRELGRGASGKVYLAEDPFAKRQVAIKVAFPDALKHSEDGAFYRSMFMNEAALAGKLNHPHIVQIFDAVVEDQYSYIVMEFVEGGTLEKFCIAEQLLEPREIAEITFKCVRALAFAQTLGLTHRDLKPGNILHSDGTDIKIADFGASINKISDRTIITNVGSPAYMSPELVTGQAQASHNSDIYALGVVMYYLLAGRLPFAGANTMSVIYQIVNTDPEPPSTHRQGITPEIDKIVMKAMARDPAARFATWEEFGAALAETWKHEAANEKRDQSDTERFSLARTLPFFREFPENELWEVLRISKWAKFKPDTALIKEGDHGDSFFILAGGYVRVTRGKRTLNVLTAGDCFGEMSYLAQKKVAPHRSATVTTTSDCIVIKIRAEDLRAASLSCRRLFDERFLNTLVDRLENANEQLSVMS
ncbi:serine/threonine-protein kinase [Usitatibacter palustris]|uniref:Serine/threonine-protein kinase PknD n=1 Tax=Usitatibacter palustris TaxID=2732487 RepID=A0A6M4H651_9PROT|nr:serine/threonine-protein kinase [Usitatibacter palustris]QJR13964.1 Serine/threonine-protein kinase PknD [Usitatibacter palustris]